MKNKNSTTKLAVQNFENKNWFIKTSKNTEIIAPNIVIAGGQESMTNAPHAIHFRSNEKLEE